MPSPHPNIEPRIDPIKGLALHATTSVPAGTLITAPINPLILLPSLSHLPGICTYCFKPSQLKACGRCHSAYYCNAQCQRSHWQAIHGKECKILAGLQGKELPTPVRALMQCLLHPNIADGVEPLEGHVQARRRRDEWKNLEMMAMGAASLAGKGKTTAELQHAVETLCKIQTNAFHRYDVDLGQVGIFLEPYLAGMNHSCVPNAFVQFIGRQAILIAEMDIKAGDEIEISYTDYTYPLSKRQEALSAYIFECRCLRCKDDLNVYKVCAKSPNLKYNSLAAAISVVQLDAKDPLFASESDSMAQAESERATDAFDVDPIPDSGTERMKTLRKHCRECKQLVDKDLWAVSPLPQILSEISISYIEEGNYAHALAVSCFVATSCDPYRFPAPFHPVRIKGLFMIATLLANTAEDTAAISNSIVSLKRGANLSDKTQQTLQDIDQVALCQMLLMMVLKMAPKGGDEEGEQAKSARDMLEDIAKLPGREKELTLIKGWAEKPQDESSQAFFKYAVVDQIHALASLGRAALELDF